MSQATSSSDKILRQFALFFLFAFLDERLAMEVADRAVTTYRSKIKNIEPESFAAHKLLVSICFDQWKSNKKRIARGQPSSHLKDFGQMPPGFEEAAWMRFQKDAAEEELLAILFSQILRIPDVEICDALKISSGTLRHRVGRGVRLLGDYAS